MSAEATFLSSRRLGAFAQRLQRVVDALHAGPELVMALQADANLARRKIIEVHHVLGHAAEKQRLVHRRRHRVELLAVLEARHEQHVDAHGLVGFQPRDGVFDAGDADRAGAADDDEARVLAPGQRRAHLADALLDRKELPLFAAERGRQQRVLDGQRRDARGLQFLDRALDAHRIAVAVVGVDAERQRSGAVDAVGLLRKFGQRQHANVGRRDHAERTDRTREHHRFEAHVGGDPRRNAVVDGRRINTSFTIDDGAQPLAPLGPVHCPCPSENAPKSVPF